MQLHGIWLTFEFWSNFWKMFGNKIKNFLFSPSFYSFIFFTVHVLHIVDSSYHNCSKDEGLGKKPPVYKDFLGGKSRKRMWSPNLRISADRPKGLQAFWASGHQRWPKSSRTRPLFSLFYVMRKCLQAFCKTLYCLLALTLTGPDKISCFVLTLHCQKDVIKSPATSLACFLYLEAPMRYIHLFYAEHFDNR